MISNSAVGVAGIKFEVRPRRQPEPQTQKDSGWLGNRRNAILRICFQPFGRVDPFSGSVTKADAGLEDLCKVSLQKSLFGAAERPRTRSSTTFAV